MAVALALAPPKAKAPAPAPTAAPEWVPLTRRFGRIFVTCDDGQENKYKHSTNIKMKK